MKATKRAAVIPVVRCDQNRIFRNMCGVLLGLTGCAVLEVRAAERPQANCLREKTGVSLGKSSSAAGGTPGKGPHPIRVCSIRVEECFYAERYQGISFRRGESRGAG